MKNAIQHLSISDAQWSNAFETDQSVVKIETSTGNYWLKKAAPARGIFRYHALNLFSKALRLPLLKAVPQPGGEAAILNETIRLTSLAENNINVPKLLAHGKDWLLIEDVGDSIVKQLKAKATTQQQRQHLFSLCLEAIKGVHLNDQYLSQCFVRNMLINQDEEVVFIDFEDDPRTVMSVPEAQARDLLLFINSTARFFINDQSFFKQQVQRFLKDHDKTMIDTLEHTVKKMRWLTKVPFQQWLGHDYQKLKLGILALQGIETAVL